jgi:hypothetical protein
MNSEHSDCSSQDVRWLLVLWRPVMSMGTNERILSILFDQGAPDFQRGACSCSASGPAGRSILS